MIFGKRKKQVELLERQMAEQAYENLRAQRQMQEQIQLQEQEQRIREQERIQIAEENRKHREAQWQLEKDLLERQQREQKRRDEEILRVKMERKRQQAEELHKFKEAQWKLDKDRLERQQSEQRRREEKILEVQMERRQQEEQRRRTIDAMVQRRKEMLQATTTESLRSLRDLVREKYKLDLEIWAGKGARRPDRPLILAKMEKADAVLMEIQNKVENWEKNAFNEAEWAVARVVKQRILATQGKRWWRNNPPWNDS